VADFALLAPQAEAHTWYPYSFMAKPEMNEPWLSSALVLLKDLVNEVSEQGIGAEKTYFLGFSQGACLSLEFVTRHATHYGGVVAFTGGLIGDKIQSEKYKGNFEETPVFISTGDPDPHVPVARVHDTVGILETMNARVKLEIYPDRPHTVSRAEIDLAKTFIFNS